MGLFGTILDIIRPDGPHSTRPEDYEPMAFKWDVDGKEYSPCTFDHMITRNWSGPPVVGRFLNEEKWRSYSYFVKILDQLEPSCEQREFLEKNGVEQIEALSFRQATKLVSDIKDKLSEERAREKEAKGRLPATKQALKKLDEHGIAYADGITRQEAKTLLDNFKLVEGSRENIKNLQKHGLAISEELLASSQVTEGGMSIHDYLDTLNDSLSDIEKLKVDFATPDLTTFYSIAGFSDKLENAILEAEDVEDQIKDRDLFADEEYRLVGKLPKAQLNAVKKYVVERYLQDAWDADRDIVDCIRTYLPDVELRVVE